MTEEAVATTLFPDPSQKLFLEQTLSILIFYHGGLNDNIIEKAVEPFLIPGQSTNEVQKWAKNYVKEARDHTLGFFMQTMPVLVERFGGKRWEASSEEQRECYVIDKFNEHRSAVSKLAFKYESKAVAFDAIFNIGGGNMLSWQRFVRIKFVSLALKTYDYKIAGGNLSELENFWANVSRCQMIKDLKYPDLGGVGDVPTHDMPAYKKK